MYKDPLETEAGKNGFSCKTDIPLLKIVDSPDYKLTVSIMYWEPSCEHGRALDYTVEM